MSNQYFCKALRAFGFLPRFDFGSILTIFLNELGILTKFTDTATLKM
jgi:hypothetical protein